MVKVTEYKRGLSRSTSYHFVIDGNKLVHISKYAISIQDKRDYVEYEVDLSRLIGKNIIEILVSNSGIICLAEEYPAQDLSLSFGSRRITNRPLSYLNNFEFTHLTSDEKKFLQGDWKQYYIPMIEQIRIFLNLIKNKGLNLLRGFTQDIHAYLPQLAQCQIESGANYPLSYLIPYSDRAREKSLEGLTKEIHQIWIASRIIEELDRLNALGSLTPSSGNSQFIDFKQGSSYPIATFNCSSGTCSLWYEFELTAHTMCNGMLWYLNKLPSGIEKIYERASKIYKDALKLVHEERIPLRPDIVILSNINSCEDIKNASDIRFKVFIECKNLDIQYWLNDVDNQVIPYKQILQPDIALVASLKKVPDGIKAKLSKHGIKVIDEVYPGEKGEKELLQIITSLTS